MAATGYLQARFRVCVAFGSAGVFNFGPTGTTQPVADTAAAAARDRAMARRIGVAAAAIGVGVAVSAALLPL